ncbi:MAG: hypothetical protein NTY16_06525, partial [Deltaproteobacteria bacterium]|nr:hypothetical protein [Deltaproteobacteria bacterium]
DKIVVMVSLSNHERPVSSAGQAFEQPDEKCVFQHLFRYQAPGKYNLFWFISNLVAGSERVFND